MESFFIGFTIESILQNRCEGIFRFHGSIIIAGQIPDIMRSECETISNIGILQHF